MTMRSAISVLTEVNEIIDARIKAVADSRPESEGYAAELARCISDHEIRVLRQLKDDIGMIKPNNWPTRGLLRRCVNKAVIKSIWSLKWDEKYMKRVHQDGVKLEGTGSAASLFELIVDIRSQLVFEGYDAENIKRWKELDSNMIKELRCHPAVKNIIRFEKKGKTVARSGLVQFRSPLMDEFAAKHEAVNRVS